MEGGIVADQVLNEAWLAGVENMFWYGNHNAIQWAAQQGGRQDGLPDYYLHTVQMTTEGVFHIYNVPPPIIGDYVVGFDPYYDGKPEPTPNILQQMKLL